MQINPEIKLSNLGGKAYQLNLLKNVCVVPEFFTISVDNINEIEDEKNQKMILKYFQDSKFEKVSVRSSATVEDSENNSFAGMFDTILNVDKNNLISSIKEVLISAKSERVKEYCKINNIEFDDIKMNVVVQKMINSRVSGVCFSKTKESETSMLMEACLGLGEALVSGIVTPDTYFVNRSDGNLEKQIIGYQKTMLKNLEYVEIPFHKRNAKKLTNDEIKELAEIVIKIEKDLSYKAVDVEWAFEDDKLYILQARPFTGINE